MGKMATIQTVDKKVLRKLKKLFTSRDYGLINQGHEVLRSLNDAGICNYFLDGTNYSPKDDGLLVTNSIFSGTRPAQPYLNYALIGVIAFAPEDCEIAVNLKQSINRLSIVLSFTDPLAEFENLEFLDLTGSEELENLVGLASLKKLKHINLKGCKSLRKADEIQECKSLETLSMEDCISLTSLKLNGLTQLNLVELTTTLDVDQVWNLRTLELRHLPSLKELKLHGDSKSWNYAGMIYAFIELEELVLDSLAILESVDISWVYPLTKLIISNCPSMHSLKREQLDLSYRYHETVDLRIKNLPKLNYLCLNHLQFTTTENLRGLKAIEKLDMENCTELKDVKGIGGMTMVKNLNLTGCTSLSDLKGIEKAKSLSIITAKDCCNLTDPSAIRGLNNLIGVDFNGCKKLRPIPQTKLLGGRSDTEDYRFKLFISHGEKAPRGLNPIDQATKKLIKENFSKLKKLIRSYRLELIIQGAELVIVMNSPQLFEKFLFGTQVGDDGSLCAGPLFRAPKSSPSYERKNKQKFLNVGLLKLIQAAPEITIKNAGLNSVTDCSYLNLSTYDIDVSTLQNLDFLVKFPKLTSLDLNSWEALENVDGLGNCTNLTELNLGYCGSLKNVNGLANLTNLTNLYLDECSNVRPKPIIDSMTTREEVATYQEKIKKSMN